MTRELRFHIVTNPGFEQVAQYKESICSARLACKKMGQAINALWTLFIQVQIRNEQIDQDDALSGSASAASVSAS